MNVSKKRGRSRSARPTMWRKKTTAQVQRAPAALVLRKPEVKGVDVPLTSSKFNSTGIFTLLNATVPGASEQNRIGRKVSMKSLMIRGWVRYDQAGTTPGDDLLRCIVFYDRQPNGAAPVIADVLQDTDQAGTATTSITSNINLSNADRFKILRDWFWSVPHIVSIAGGATQDGQITDEGAKEFSFKTFIKLNGMEAHYNAGTAGTIADITTGALYLVTFGARASADAQYKLSFGARVRYLDQ